MGKKYHSASGIESGSVARNSEKLQGGRQPGGFHASKGVLARQLESRTQWCAEGGYVPMVQEQIRIGRRLSAILAADVAGYSRLMGLDEAGTARTLREHRVVSDALVATQDRKSTRLNSSH